MRWQRRDAVILVAIVLLALGLGAAACGANTPTHTAEGESQLRPIALNAEERLRVVTTTNIVTDIVSNVGDGQIALKGLLPVGTDPHTYQPAPADLRAVADAHVIFASGAGLEAFLEEMIENAGGEAAVVHASKGIDFLQLDGNGEGNGDPHGPVDPHVWFDPNNVIAWVRNVEEALRHSDPENSEAYGGNAATYIEKLEALDAWIREQVTQIPKENRKLVTDHRLFNYFAEEYGFEQIGAVVKAFSTVAEPSARELADLERKIRDHDVPAIFVGKSANAEVAERVAQDTGIKVIRLYTGSLSEPGGEADTYIKLMRYNVSAIVQALR